MSRFVRGAGLVIIAAALPNSLGATLQVGLQG